MRKLKDGNLLKFVQSMKSSMTGVSDQFVVVIFKIMNCKTLLILSTLLNDNIACQKIGRLCEFDEDSHEILKQSKDILEKPQSQSIYHESMPR